MDLLAYCLLTPSEHEDVKTGCHYQHNQSMKKEIKINTVLETRPVHKAT